MADLQPAHDTPNAQDSEGSSAPSAFAKRKSRQRLFSGLSRISSSPSLAQLGRPRASSAPLSMRASLSCVSLASTTSPVSTASPSSTLSHSTAPSSRPASPILESPAEGIESVLAIRKVENGGYGSTTAALPHDVVTTCKPKKPDACWLTLPREVKLKVLFFLRPKELVRISQVNKEFHLLCFDGQLWTRLDASEFYKEIPAQSLAKIIMGAGPFIKDLNLRGCVQVEHYKRAEVIVKACKNLVSATLEGCKNLRGDTLHTLLRTNERLASLNLTGLSAVQNSTCSIIAQTCPQLETLNVSWCKKLGARGLEIVIRRCKKLRDLRAGEVGGFANLDVARAIFETNRLERLVLCGCDSLTDHSLSTIIHGTDPEIDYLTDRPNVPPRKLRYLDLSRCSRITNDGIEALAHFVPHLEGLQLSKCTALTDAGLAPVLATTPRLTHLELEDLSEITNGLFRDHLAKAPCAPVLQHLSIGYCENIGDSGILPIMRNCVSLRSVDMDNTRISDLVLAEAVSMVRSRTSTGTSASSLSRVGLRLAVYDCMNITWTGVREIMSRNSEYTKVTPLVDGEELETILKAPSEVIALKCFYGWQQTVNEHTKRVLRGEYEAARRLVWKWTDYMQAMEEAGASGAGNRRRRRRAREAQLLHADEEDGTGRRRARTLGSCIVM